MSKFVFNEAGMADLFENPDGPVGRNLRKRAEAVAKVGNQNIDTILHRTPPGNRPRLKTDVHETGEGLEAIVGLESEGELSNYLGLKARGQIKPKGAEAFGEKGWLGEALAEGFDED